MPHRANQTSFKKGHAPTYGPEAKTPIAEGQQFNAWIIIHEVEPVRHKRRFLCRCECGREKIVWLANLIKGKSKSCGLGHERPSKRTHGMTNHPLYAVWCNMKNRCLNPNVPAYRNYGGRGIGISFIWKNDPAAFIEWALRNGWSPELEIDRMDNDGDYEPANCRFVTGTVNVNNRRRRDGDDGCQIRFPHEVAAGLSLPG